MLAVINKVFFVETLNKEERRIEGVLY